jgi:hypothetical protein
LEIRQVTEPLRIYQTTYETVDDRRIVFSVFARSLAHAIESVTELCNDCVRVIHVYPMGEWD